VKRKIKPITPVLPGDPQLSCLLWAMRNLVGVLAKTLTDPRCPGATELAVASEWAKAITAPCICVGKEVARAGHS